MTSLSASALHIAYGKNPVLDAIDLPDLTGGQIVGVLGANGSGKSTLLRTLAGQQRYRGTITVDGRPLSDLPADMRARLIGYLPQSLPQPTSLLAYEAVTSACRAIRPELSRQDVEAAAEGVFDLLGIRDLAFRSLVRMSGGQRQMVGLAQVLVLEPKLLLLDEPTSALDLRWQLRLLRVIRDVVAQRNALCLMALHDINFALRHCDQVALLSARSLVALGSPDTAITEAHLRSVFAIDASIERSTTGIPFVAVREMIEPTARSD